MLLLPLALTLACSTEGTVDCASIADTPQRDRCLADSVMARGPDQVGTVLQEATAIEDHIVQGATVSRWVAANAAAIPRSEGEALCNLLDQQDRSYCMRRLASPHLQR